MFNPNDHVLDHVDAYLHDLLTVEEAEILEKHCAGCKICQAAMEEARQRFETLKALPAVEISESLIRATRAKIERHRECRWTPVRMGWLAAAVLLIMFGGLHIYYLTLSPSPYDLRLLGQSELLAGSGASLRVLLIDHMTGKPIEGAPVEIDLADRKNDRTIRLVSFTTDPSGSGSPRFTLPDWDAGEYELQVAAHPGGAGERIARTVKLKRSWRLMLTSDKPVYQPGQTIHVRSLALAQPDLKPVAGHNVSYAIRDPKGNVIFRKQDVTSRFGIASAECPLADEIIEGAYQVECRVGDTTSTMTVDVKKYVLPKFKIDVSLDQPYYQPGQKVRGKVDARYFFGKPVENAAVEIAVDAADVGTSTICKLERRTDATGAASFEFNLPDRLVGREQLSGDASISIRATVVDSAGQKEVKTQSRVVTAQPIHVEVIPESGTLVKDVANYVYIFTSYPDGQPARTRVTIRDIHEEFRSSPLGVTRVEVTPNAPIVPWTVHATDDAGKTGRREVILDCGKAADDFLVRTDAAVYDGGQTMHLLALGGGNEPVFLDLLKDGQTILTDRIPMSDGRGQYAFDLPPDLMGTLELSAYRYASAGLPVRKTQVIYVRPSHDVKIETTLDRKEYRPGERAKIRFRLTGPANRPMPGALSLAAIDEAVFSVLGQRPGMEKAFFSLEQELLKPVYAIYPWSPDMLPNAKPADRADLEKALFSRVAKEPAGVDERRNGISRFEEPKSIGLAKNGTYSLDAMSYPDKVREATEQQGTVQHLIVMMWVFLVIVGAVVVLWNIFRELSMSGGVIATILVMLVLLLPFLLAAMVHVSQPAQVFRIADLAASGQIAHSSALKRQEQRPPMASETAAAVPLRVREWFPETLLWRPELITDDEGHASIDLDLADSITTWRLSASAVTAEGRLGADQMAIRVFQPFFVDLNLPVALTRGDEVTVPVVVYNYLDKSQTVELTLTDGKWFQRLGEASQKLELAAGEVRSVGYRIRAQKVGRFELEISARGSGVTDAVKRPIEVAPDGKRVEQVFNGTLQQPAEITCTAPEQTIEGSVKAILRIYPSSFSQVVEGLDAIFQRPYGCFEQTSSTTYPNVLALSYLQQNNRSLPEVEAKARQYIHLGYQRLLSFEVPGGGFDWFGNPPANRTLTAYGLMEFQDMARVHDVDPKLIERTRQWLLSQRQADGSWDPEGHMLHEDPTHGTGGYARLSTTAYLTWAIFQSGNAQNDWLTTRQYLLTHRPEAIDDPYVLALVANALLALYPAGTDSAPYLDRLESLKITSADGKLVWWDSPAGRTMFYGAGRSGSIETTSLAAFAMLHTGRYPATVRGALTWLVGQRDGGGTWHSTQATVLALKALLASTGKSLSNDRPQYIEIRCDGKPVRDLVVPVTQYDVVQQIDLSSHIAAGKHVVTITDRGGTAPTYQMSLRYHVPSTKEQAGHEGLSIGLAYDKTTLSVNDSVGVAATVVNKTSEAAPMIILDLPIPAGFAMVSEGFDKLVAAGTIAKYQLTPRSAVVYLRELSPGKPLVLPYRLRATMPVKLTVPAARAYEYYDPDRQAASNAAELIVSGSDAAGR